MIEVTALWYYPLKGARGIATASMELDRFGPRFDRRWMVVDPAGRQVTQREVPRLCQVAATPTADGLRLSAPDHGTHVVANDTEEGEAITVRVWKDNCIAHDLGDDAAVWCSGWLGRDCRLVHMPETTVRATDPLFDSGGGRVSFADGFPLLVTTEASLAALNARLDQPLPMNRFRPNVVVHGTEPFAEDRWRGFRIGGLRFEAVKPCARCKVTTIDQTTAERGVEPLSTLATLHRGPTGALFGVNVVHRDRGRVQCGARVVLD